MIKKIILFSILISQFTISCSGDDESLKTDSQSITTENTQLEFPVCTTLELADKTNITSRAVFKNNNKWIAGQTIKIGFVGGTVALQNKVQEYANQWTTYSNLKFQYVQTNEVSDVKIYFEKGSNYTFGKSINFGQLILPNITDDLIKSIVLHEFGHLLGLQHENQSPNANIQWNKPVVYDYYGKQFNWSKEQVDSQIFNPLPNSRYDTLTEYDSASIMAYSFPASFTTNGFSVPFTSTLSSTDKHFIRKMYPFPIQSKLYNGQRLYIDQRITSPNGKFYLTIAIVDFVRKLAAFDDIKSKLIWSREPNIKLSNFSSKNVYCEIQGGELLLFQGSVSRKITGDSSLINVDYATITDDGDIQLIKNNIPVWSFYNGKTN